MKPLVTSITHPAANIVESKLTEPKLVAAL